MTSKAPATFSDSICRFAARMDLTFLDIGARGGLDDALLPLAAGVTAIGFEPEPQEAALLRSEGDGRWRHIRILPVAVGGATGKGKLHVPPAPAGASLMPHNLSMLDRFGHDDLHGTGRIIDVSTVSLDELCEQGELRRADYMKIDVEGAELGVLQGASRLLRTCMAVKVECSFLEQRVGQPRVGEVVAHMLTQGFELIDVLDVHRWRRRPLPTHPYSAAFAMPYSRGQVAQCDLVLLRRADTLDDASNLSALVLVAACHGYFDYAISVLRDHPEVERLIASECGANLEHELALLSQTEGRAAAVREIRHSLRNLVPLLRSLIGGLPVTPPRRPY